MLPLVVILYDVARSRLRKILLLFGYHFREIRLREINWGYYVGKAKEVRTLPVDISDIRIKCLERR